ncbi:MULTISPECIES: hypothetical protein [Paraburkholderia]|uniref:hypothetical protein n=1 Tax=Paraburkholderia TaxID=1822464 RepID=UPI00101A35C4|nr:MULTISPECIES: hypothetical protein [Paraburkholderia]
MIVRIMLLSGPGGASLPIAMIAMARAHSYRQPALFRLLHYSDGRNRRGICGYLAALLRERGLGGEAWAG